MGRLDVLRVVESVRDAVDKECWIPALMTALTLPDLLGQVEFSGLVHNGGKRDVGAQYRAWFAKHVEHLYADEHGWDEEWRAVNPYFDAGMCYKLRCTMLHQGSDAIAFEFNYADEDADDSEYSYSFTLRANSCDSYGAWWSDPLSGERMRKAIHVTVDVGTLCKAICDASEGYIESVDDVEFAGLGVHIVDVSKALACRTAAPVLD